MRFQETEGLRTISLQTPLKGDRTLRCSTKGQEEVRKTFLPLGQTVYRQWSESREGKPKRLNLQTEGWTASLSVERSETQGGVLTNEEKKTLFYILTFVFFNYSPNE